MKARLTLLVLFVCSCSSSKSDQSNLDTGIPIAAGDDSAAVALDTRLPDDVLAKDTLGPSPTSDANGTPGPEAGKADASTGKDAPAADTSLPADSRGPDASGVETGSTGLTFSIDINKGPTRQYQAPSAPTAVSPYVYGINGFGKFVATKTQWGLIRQGGDGFTAYNWTNDYTNSGADYCYYQGAADNGNLAGKYTNTTGDTIPTAQAKGEAFLTTIPVLDFVAAKYDRNTGWSPSGSSPCPGVDSTCASWSNTLAANIVDPNTGDPGYNKALDFASSDPSSPAFVKNVMTKGSVFCSCAPGTTSCAGCTVGTNPVAQDEFVNFLKVNYGSGAPIFFSLDNEPNYWSSTHPELWPNTCGKGTITYDDIVTRNKVAALAIKSAWPAAQVFGPVVAQDGIIYAHSYQADTHWPTEFTDYYLAQMQAASVAAGVSLLDAYDVHYYTNGGTGDDTKCVQTPRLFWDPDFSDFTASATDSLDFGWSGDVGSGAYFDTKWYPRQMIPRLQKKIAAAYPAGGVAAPGLSVSEYNPGCETTIGGGVAEADLLGVFGREGVYAATAWPLQSITGNFLVAAFDLYRNYDGNGAIVGDRAVQASSSDSKNASVYAFAHSDGSAAVDVVAINKKTTAQSVTVQIANAPALTTATLYQIAGKTAAVAKATGAAPTVTCAAGTCTLVYAMPAMSATTMILR